MRDRTALGWPRAALLDLLDRTAGLDGRPTRDKLRHMVHFTDDRLCICVGINAYPRVRDRLNGAVADALNMVNFRMSPAGGSCRNILSLLDSDATRAGLLGALNQCARRTWSHVEFYFAGHGNADGIELVDGRLAFADLVSLLDRIQARTRLIIADSCQSGGLIDLVGSAMGDIQVAMSHIQLLADSRPGLRIFTATSAYENAVEAGGRGAFSAVLIQVARRANADLRLGGVSVEKVFGGVQRHLKAQGLPLPQSGGRLRDLPFAIADWGRPFGNASVTGASINVVERWNGTAIARVNLRVGVQGRLHLPTELCLEVRDLAGRWVPIGEWMVRPSNEHTPYALATEFRTSTPQRRCWTLHLSAFDEHNQQIADQLLDIEANHYVPVQLW